MSVVLSVEESGPCRTEVKVEVPAPAVDAEFDRVLREYRKGVRLPGFRKGKAPLELLRKKYGEEIEQEVIDRLVPRYWRQAQAETELKPLLPPRVAEVEIERGEPLVFTAEVETRPVIEIGALEGFDLPGADVSVTSDEVDRALEDLRRQVGEWVAVERAAARGDRVEADMAEVKTGVDGETVAGEPQRVAFEVGDPQVWEELSLAVTNAAAGQEIAFDRTEGEGEQGVRREFELTVAEVQERELPPLDDGLAAKLGDFASLDALRVDVEAHIRRGKEQELRRERERSLLEQMRRRYPTQLPEGVVDKEVESLMREYARGLQMRGIDVEHADIDWRGVSKEVRPQAERRVHARLLLDAAAEKLGIEVGQEDLEGALAAIGRAQGASAQAVRQALARDGRLDELREQLARDKTLRRLLGEEESVTGSAMDDEDDAATATAVGGTDEEEE